MSITVQVTPGSADGQLRYRISICFSQGTLKQDKEKQLSFLYNLCYHWYQFPEHEICYFGPLTHPMQKIRSKWSLNRFLLMSNPETPYGRVNDQVYFLYFDTKTIWIR